MTIDGIKDIIRSQLTRKWNSAVTGLATQIFFVECGIKTGFIWDIGPSIDSTTIVKIMSALRQSKLVSHNLRILQIVDDFCIVNIQSYLNINLNDVTFVNVTSTLLQPQICDLLELTPLVTALNRQIKDFCNSEELFREVLIDSSLCIPTLFGLVAGFPIIYYYDPLVSDQNCLANVSLRIHQVWFRNETLLFSVSCPVKLIDENNNFQRKIELWRDSFKGNEDLVFKLLEETLSIVIL